MPRKKNTVEPISIVNPNQVTPPETEPQLEPTNVESAVTAKPIPKTLKRLRPVKPVAETVPEVEPVKGKAASETVADSVSEEDIEIAISFRSSTPAILQTPAPRAVATRSKTTATKPALSKSVVTTPTTNDLKESEEQDDLMIELFRSPRKQDSLESAPSAPAEVSSTRSTPRTRSNQQSRSPKQPAESIPPVESDDEVDLDSNVLVEFEPTETFELEEDGAELFVQMRTSLPRSPRPKRSHRTVEPSSDEPESAIPVVIPVTPSRPEKVVIPPRALIEIPEDAPQIVFRNGLPTLVRDHRVIPNLWFYSQISSSERESIVLDEIRQASEAGVLVYAIGFDVEIEESAINALQTRAEKLIQTIRSIKADAQVILSLDLTAPKGWEKDFTDGVFKVGGQIHEPSISSTTFWKNANGLFSKMAKSLCSGSCSDNFLGLEITKDYWRLGKAGYSDQSPAAQAGFRDWIRERYHGDEVLLRSSWFDGQAAFDTVQIPQPDRRELNGRMVRLDRKERALSDYHLFLSDQTMARIGDLAYSIKEASGGRCLVGTRYGVSLSDTSPTSGQFALGKLLRTPEIDFVCAAPSYSDRQPSGVASLPVPVDSFTLNGKLFVSIQDYKTSLANRPEPDQQNPVIRTPQALEGVHLRDLGAALAHSSGLMWSDQWGNGWLTAASVWQRAKYVNETLVRSMGATLKDPDVAIFLDERAMGLLVGTKSFDNLIRDVQNAVGRAGVSYGFYLLSDLAHRERFPECKVNIFLNAWDIRQELRTAIKQRLHRNGKVLFWCYCSGLFDGGRESLERAREVMGIAIKPQPIFSRAGTTILDRRNPISQAFAQGLISTDAHLEPTYFAIPEDGSVLGEYSNTGLASFVMREQMGEESNQTWTSVFLGEPTFNTELLRALALKSGAHVWGFQEDVIHVRPPFLTIHCKGDGVRTIALPGKWSAYNLGTREWVTVDSTHLKFSSADGVTHSFLVGQTDELRQILEIDPRELLRMTELPTRESNIRIDVSNFDVPIMRMDEWSSEAEVEDGVDDWFFKHNQDDYEEDASLAPDTIQRTSTGRRRRDRRKGRGKKESFADQVDFEPTAQEQLKERNDVSLEILFRKKD